MRRRFNALAAGAATVGLWAGCAEAAPVRYDCDTAAGAYSMIDFAQAGPDYLITGRVAAVAFRSHRRWSPVATVRLTSTEDKASVAIRIQRTGAGRPIEAVVETHADGMQQSTNVGSLRLGESAAFKIEVVGGSARVTMAGQSQELAPIIGRNAKIEISCSTGQFKFEELDWDAPAARQGR